VRLYGLTNSVNLEPRYNIPPTGDTLVTTVKGGTARLREGRRITAARQPYLFRANLVALCVVVLIFIAMIYLGLTAS
jgi:hypothetical protein